MTKVNIVLVRYIPDLLGQGNTLNIWTTLDLSWPPRRGAHPPQTDPPRPAHVKYDDNSVINDSSMGLELRGPRPEVSTPHQEGQEEVQIWSCLACSSLGLWASF